MIADSQFFEIAPNPRQPSSHFRARETTRFLPEAQPRPYGLYADLFVEEIALQAPSSFPHLSALPLSKLLKQVVLAAALTDLEIVFLSHFAAMLRWELHALRDFLPCSLVPPSRSLAPDSSNGLPEWRIPGTQPPSPSKPDALQGPEEALARLLHPGSSHPHAPSSRERLARRREAVKLDQEKEQPRLGSSPARTTKQSKVFVQAQPATPSWRKEAAADRVCPERLSTSSERLRPSPPLATNPPEQHSAAQSLELFLQFLACFVKEYLEGREIAQELKAQFSASLDSWESAYQRWVALLPDEVFRPSPRAVNQLFGRMASQCQAAPHRKDYNRLVDKIVEMSKNYGMIPARPTEIFPIDEEPHSASSEPRPGDSRDCSFTRSRGGQRALPFEADSPDPPKLGLEAKEASARLGEAHSKSRGEAPPPKGQPKKGIGKSVPGDFCPTAKSKEDRSKAESQPGWAQEPFRKYQVSRLEPADPAGSALVFRPSSAEEARLEEMASKARREHSQANESNASNFLANLMGESGGLPFGPLSRQDDIFFKSSGNVGWANGFPDASQPGASLLDRSPLGELGLSRFSLGSLGESKGGLRRDSGEGEWPDRERTPRKKVSLGYKALPSKVNINQSVNAFFASGLDDSPASKRR